MDNFDSGDEVAYLESFQPLRQSLRISTNDNIPSMQNDEKSRNGGRSLIELTRIHAGQACEDPRDKFYGMRAIIRDEEHLILD